MDELDRGSLITIPQFSSMRFVVSDQRHGAMGIVYRLVPVDPLLPDYALKVVLGNNRLDMAEREAQMWVALGNHTGLAHALWAGQWHDKPSILSHWYARSADSIKLDEWKYESLLRFTSELLEGLRYANDRFGLIHRDIKPLNILIDNQRSARLTDFGLALTAPVETVVTEHSALEWRSIRHCVTVNDIAGTPRYMAPEMFTGQPASVRTDIFALGVSLFELITSEHPFIDSGNCWRSERSKEKCLTSAMTRIGARSPNVLYELIISCLSIDPAKRPGSYDYLLGKLKHPINIVNFEHPGVTSSVHPDAESIVGLAITLRNQGKQDEARNVLIRSLRTAPRDPLILNSMGVLELHLGKPTIAINYWKTASEQLVSDEGIYSGSVYCDPVVNLGRQMIGLRYFGDAARWLTLSREWIDKLSPQNALQYPELGWLLLYERNPSAALNHLLKYEQYNECDGTTLLWLAESALLTNGASDSQAEFSDREMDNTIIIRSKSIPADQEVERSHRKG